MSEPQHPLQFIHAFIAAYRLLDQNEKDDLRWRGLYEAFDNYQTRQRVLSLCYVLDGYDPDAEQAIAQVESQLQQMRTEIETRMGNIKNEVAVRLRGYT